jgi:RNA polymerase sigma-70 factor (ECF subfamily)
MDHDRQWRDMLSGLRDGDAGVARAFWDQFGPVLHKIADKHLGERLRRRLGPEDVVQSVCRTFFRRAQGGQLELGDADSLWSLLCAITLNKIREKARFHGRQKRGFDQEVQAAPAAGDSMASGFQLFDKGPSPDQAAEFADQFEQILSLLDEEERQILDLKLQDHTHEEIAEKLGTSERTVRRIMKRIQSRLARELAFD